MATDPDKQVSVEVSAPQETQSADVKSRVDELTSGLSAAMKIINRLEVELADTRARLAEVEDSVDDGTDTRDADTPITNIVGGSGLMVERSGQTVSIAAAVPGWTVDGTATPIDVSVQRHRVKALAWNALSGLTVQGDTATKRNGRDYYIADDPPYVVLTVADIAAAAGGGILDGDYEGQMLFWDEVGQTWALTEYPTAATDGQILSWDSTQKKWVISDAPAATGAIPYWDAADCKYKFLEMGDEYQYIRAGSSIPKYDYYRAIS